jgi:hypothetical protein
MRDGDDQRAHGHDVAYCDWSMHRTGSYASGRNQDTRRCVSAKEMRAKGMQRSPKGIWNSGQFARRVEQGELWTALEKVSA